MDAESPQDDELVVGVAEDVRVPNLAAVELPLAVKPNESGIQSALSFIGGIEELSKVTADEVLRVYHTYNNTQQYAQNAQQRGRRTYSSI